MFVNRFLTPSAVAAALLGASLSACGGDPGPQVAWPASPSLAVAHSIPLGAPAPARDPACDVAFERLSPRQAMERWDEVGVICVSLTDQETVDSVFAPGLTHDAARKHACALGAQTVVPIGLCSGGSRNEYGIELGAFRAASAADEPPKPKP